MKYLYSVKIVCFCLTLALTSQCLFSSAQAQALEAPPQLDEATRQLLENSLSVNELDQEIKRITDQQHVAQTKYTQLEKSLTHQEKLLSQARHQADSVLVSYYTGERDDFWALFLSTGSLSGMIAFYDYYRMIIDHDQLLLSDYQEQYTQLTQQKNELYATATELGEISSNLSNQRIRVANLQQSIHQSLATSSNPEIARQLMNEMNEYWKNIGLYEVKKYFRAIAISMQQFPDYLKSQPGAIQISGTHYTISIDEQQLNQFLHVQGQLPESFQFKFAQNQLSIHGKEGNLDLDITGHYEIVNQPQNTIQFYVDKLVFNGLQLPDTTCRMLENEFDLGFYPQQIIAYLKATGVTTEPKLMKIQLELSLN
ncbi:Skp family chaperone for outer membrane proteins [Paenibacillus sp. SORGH_AS306]|uniref:hypothetical protein n=1 Tax=unclassified Paenibacillus TaxID=185978 RepID=UPI002782412C|nr:MULTISPECIES: hypothetical protein [unclassified Paenibacillus]MDQ1235023.1 Skp family chaperone for outer membrane proteins [Paenibacillus sp. SORGH_AS_0306]MDR6112071.1 Skp family chaperone for outer membrane proteins [Paenibacillus sp. SORGH_AS_0338]